MQHSLVSLLLRYTIEAWFTKGDKFLCGDLRVHARARMGPGQRLVRVKLPIRDEATGETDGLFDTSANADLLSILDGQTVTTAVFHKHCIDTLQQTKPGLLWYLVYDSPTSGRKICTGGLTVQVMPDGEHVISKFVSACGSDAEYVLWLYLINLCDTRGHDIYVVHPSQHSCIRWPLIACGFLQVGEKEDATFVRICTERMVTKRRDAMVVAIRQIAQFMLDIELKKGKKNPLSNISISSVS